MFDITSVICGIIYGLYYSWYYLRILFNTFNLLKRSYSSSNTVSIVYRGKVHELNISRPFLPDSNIYRLYTFPKNIPSIISDEAKRDEEDIRRNLCADCDTYGTLQIGSIGNICTSCHKLRMDCDFDTCCREEVESKNFAGACIHDLNPRYHEEDLEKIENFKDMEIVELFLSYLMGSRRNMLIVSEDI